MVHISRTLTFYKRPEIQKEIVRTAEQREVAMKYGEKGFGKRPDVLKYPLDVLELAKQGATSFHVSEERWQNPLVLTPEMNKTDIDTQRTGWDLVIDVDFPLWEITKIITHSLIQALKEHGISSVSCKFSGNKGFHIGVPFEAFPDNVQGVETQLLFPDSIKRVVAYLADYVDGRRNNFALSKQILANSSFKKYAAKHGNKSLVLDICSDCGTEVKLKKDNLVEFICPVCERTKKADNTVKFMLCERCKKHMQKIEQKAKNRCRACSSKSFRKKINLAIDTMLISPRHLYRSVYSFNEKSGLISVPVNPGNVLKFEKKTAELKSIKNINDKAIANITFLNAKNVKKNEARKLIIAAFDHKPLEHKDGDKSERTYKEFDLPETAFGEETFPPCIKNILSGLEDGKKRSVFILTNYLTTVGWAYEQIEKLLYEWNKRNKEKLREVNIKGHIRYHKTQKKRILPPNCANRAYYLDFGVCEPDTLCPMIKNPVQYSRRRSKILEQNKKPTRKKKKTKKDERKTKKAKDHPGNTEKK